MAQELYSVEEVAARLGLHVKTVRSYVRAGRLNAVRIGKQYRIARADLEALTGRPASALETSGVRRQRHVEASSIIEIDAISGADAARLTTLLMAAAKTPREGDDRLRVDSIYDEERARLKIVLIGGLKTTSEFCKMIGALALLEE